MVPFPLATRLPGKALALSLACLAGPAFADTDLQAEIDALKQRLSKLEQRNQALEQALDSERISENEPQEATRIKAVEEDVARLQPAAKLSEALDGVSVNASITGVAQHLDHAATTGSRSQLNWRGDIGVNVPTGDLGTAKGNVFVHLRMGQGNGVAIAGEPPINATVFNLHGTGSNSNADIILAEAWYRMDIPLGSTGEKADRHLEFTAGKIDPYSLFDQNAGSDDESSQNLNLFFVHNPLLDAGGGAVFDEYGFAPGLRFGYYDGMDSPQGWGLSAGVFATNGGASFDNSFDHSFSIAQFETVQHFFGGLEGNYRLYAWNTEQGRSFDDTYGKQSGWGLSADQRLGDGMTVWGRYGQIVSGAPMYDRAVTLGINFSGNYWSRGKDSLGLSLGHLRASDAYRSHLASATDSEQVAELYYNWQMVPGIVLTPDVQYIRHPAADSANDNATVLGLRATLSM
ncbi:MAG TPA: carbohydrate porin [Parasulfuritortus sp.]